MTTATWTDNPATSSTRIRAVHINELRTTVDNDRAAVKLNAYPWTDNPVSTTTHIRAVHFGELRTAIQELWFIKRLGPLPNWSVGTPPNPNRPISARDINDLRNWVDTYEASPLPGDPQGIVSFCYDPTAGPNGTPVTVSDEFCQDAGNLTPVSSPKLLIRTRIIADGNNTVSQSGYQGAMQVWSRNGFSSVGGVLALDFDHAIAGCPNAALGYQGDPLLNPYIADFAAKAQSFAAALATKGLSTFWIWNEPNVSGIIGQGSNCPTANSALAPEVFGAMLYKTGLALKAGGAVAVYTGSLSMLPPNTDPTGPYGAQYLDAMYKYLNAHGVTAPYPWDAWSLNVENYPDSDFLITVKAVLSQKQVQYGDFSPFVIGEWGTSNADYDFPSAQSAYQALRANFSTMYFYTHPLDPTNGFGASYWNATDGVFTTDGQEVWYAGLQVLYQSP